MIADLTAQRLYAAIRAAGVMITGVSVFDVTNRATWTVVPANLQADAQPIIDAFTIVPPPAMPVTVPGRYLGVLNADPELTNDGDTWMLREAFPTQTRTMKFRDGDVTRTLLTLVL